MLIAVAIFLIAYVIIASEKYPRHWVALIGGALLIIFGILNPLEAFHYINWETLGLLLGMFILVAVLIESGFFGWLALETVRRTNYHPAKVIHFAATTRGAYGNHDGQHHGDVVPLGAHLPTVQAAEDRSDSADHRRSVRSQCRRFGHFGGVTRPT